jgi:hypothetical protein
MESCRCGERGEKEKSGKNDKHKTNKESDNPF